jgi:HlyD family secretion protein
MMHKGWIGLAALVLLLAAGWNLWGGKRQDETPQYRTEKTDRGDITLQVSANGTLNPVTLVNVGTQVSGTVKSIYADFNQVVKAGQVLAELDPALLQAALAQSSANLVNAQAQLKLTQATEARLQGLFKQEYISRQELDQAIAAREQALAQVRVATAQVARDTTNLGFSVIRSPVDGTVIDRQIDVGQTVAASFQTPTLFRIGKDLTRMQVDSTVAEADIGMVKVGQWVKFRVDAFPDEDFKGRARQIRLNARTEQNVVTYNVVVDVSNPDRTLLPGMTANLRFQIETKKDVPRVPTAAMRFRPTDGADGNGRPEGGKKRGGQGVYTLVDGKLARVAIKTGISDKEFTEVLSGELKSGTEVVVSDLSAKKKDAAAPGGMPRGRLF